MEIKIHINNKKLYLCDQLTERLEQLHHQPDTIFIDDLDNHSVKAMLHELALPEIQRGIFLHPDFTELKKAFFKKFELIQAAGGLVTNENNNVLMIFRRGFWDLPKGKLDEGESLEECAVREVQEETGLENVILQQPLLITYHTYEHGTRHVLKESHWYLMTASEKEKLVPQTEEDIEKIIWATPAEIDQYKGLAYASIVDVIGAWQHQQDK